MENELFKSEQFKSHFLETERKFGQKNPEIFYSLKLDSVSLQAIQIIVKNLQINGLEPNHVTIHSKLKEFFGL